MTPPPAYAWLLADDIPDWTAELLKEYGTVFQHAPPPPTIVEWEKEIGAFSNGYYAWCGLTQAAMMKRAGIKPPAIPLRAISWATWGTPVAAPELGDILVFTWTMGSDRGGSHVTSYVGEDEEGFYHCLGGNQSHCVDIGRFPKSELHAARRPIGHSGLGKRLLSPTGELEKA